MLQENPEEFSSKSSSLYYSLNRSGESRLGPQNDKNFVLDNPESSPSLTQNSSFLTTRSDAKQNTQNNGVAVSSPKTSPTHPILVASSAGASMEKPLRGQVHAPVTSAATASGNDFEIHRPRITSLPPGVTSGVAGPVFLNAGVPVIQRSTELEVEYSENISPPIKSLSGKGLLPYNVTPPRPSVIYLLLYINMILLSLTHSPNYLLLFLKIKWFILLFSDFTSSKKSH